MLATKKKKVNKKKKKTKASSGSLRSSSLTKLKSIPSSTTAATDFIKDGREIKSASSHITAAERHLMHDDSMKITTGAMGKTTASKSPQKDKVKEVEIAVEQYLMEYHDSITTTTATTTSLTQSVHPATITSALMSLPPVYSASKSISNNTDKYNNESKAESTQNSSSFNTLESKGDSEYKTTSAALRSRTKSRSNSRVSDCSSSRLNNSQHQQELTNKLNDNDDDDSCSFDDEIDSDYDDNDEYYDEEDDDIDRGSSIERSSNKYSSNDEMDDEDEEEKEEESDYYLDSDSDSAASEIKFKSAYGNNNNNNSNISSGSTSTSLSVKELDKLYTNCQVKIADLGNACWIHKHFTNDIQTRQVSGQMSEFENVFTIAMCFVSHFYEAALRSTLDGHSQLCLHSHVYFFISLSHSSYPNELFL